MKSLYKLHAELEETNRMLASCLQGWGLPNGWDKVKDSLQDSLRQTRTLTERDIPAAFKDLPVKTLVPEVMDIEGEGAGRLAELELLRRLKLRKHATIQGPANVIHKDKGLLRFRSLKRLETFSGKFLAYDVGTDG